MDGRAKVEMGDLVRTLIEKEAKWGDDRFMVPKGTECLVCEVYDGEVAFCEVGGDDDMPFALVLYYPGEYEKIA